jgi:hypothetical protein
MLKMFGKLSFDRVSKEADGGAFHGAVPKKPLVRSKAFTSLCLVAVVPFAAAVIHTHQVHFVVGKYQGHL